LHGVLDFPAVFTSILTLVTMNSRFVCLWHKADMAIALSDVRF